MSGDISTAREVELFIINWHRNFYVPKGSRLVANFIFSFCPRHSLRKMLDGILQAANWLDLVETYASINVLTRPLNLHPNPQEERGGVRVVELPWGVRRFLLFFCLFVCLFVCCFFVCLFFLLFFSGGVQGGGGGRLVLFLKIGSLISTFTPNLA